MGFPSVTASTYMTEFFRLFENLFPEMLFNH